MHDFKEIKFNTKCVEYCLHKVRMNTYDDVFELTRNNIGSVNWFRLWFDTKGEFARLVKSNTLKQFENAYEKFI